MYQSPNHGNFVATLQPYQKNPYDSVQDVTNKYVQGAQPPLLSGIQMS